MKRFISCLIWFLFVASVFAQNGTKPIIGLSSTSGNGTSASVPLTYVEAVTRAGGVPVVLPIALDHELINRMLDGVDGIILTGGEDLDPLKWYGEEPLPALGEIAPVRDSFDIALTRIAVEREIPLLGICRGQQVLNEAFGGSLYQDIPSQLKGNQVKHRQSAQSHFATHTINIEKNSLLYRQIGVEKVAVNSFHHQAVKQIAPGFKTTATAADGVVEAIEKIGSNRVFAIQFHPEAFTAKGIDTFLGIFEYLVNEAQKYGQDKKTAPK